MWRLIKPVFVFGEKFSLERRGCGRVFRLHAAAPFYENTVLITCVVAVLRLTAAFRSKQGERSQPRGAGCLLRRRSSLQSAAAFSRQLLAVSIFNKLNESTWFTAAWLTYGITLLGVISMKGDGCSLSKTCPGQEDGRPRECSS